MAPLAPIVGIVEAGFMHTCASAAAAPQSKIEHDEAPVAEAIFDVVAEDPQEEHVPEEVQPAAVQEHRREDG